MSEHEHGKMDISAQETTFNGFIRVSVWACILIAITLVFLALTQT